MKPSADNTDKRLRAAALQTAKSIRHLRQRSGQELLQAKEALERKMEELAYSLSMMRATLESTTDAIVVTDLDGNLTGFNEKYAKMLGLSREMINSLDGQQLREMFSRQFKDPERFLARVVQIYASSPSDSFDILEFADGRVFERYSKTQLIDKRSVGRVWSFRDVTERNRAEIIYQRLAAIVDSSDDAIVGKDLNSIVTSWNSGAERLFGYSASEMIGTSIMRLIPPDRQTEENEILTRIRNGRRVDHFETVRMRKDGQLIDVSVTISPIKNVIGNVIGASKVARDIGERKRAEEKLQAAKMAAEKASKAKDDFLALLSHELRTPLTPALVAANYLAEHEDLLPEFREEVTAIWRNVQLEAHLIDDLLDVTRITRGKIEMHHEAVDVHRLLHTAVQIAQNDILEKQIELAIDLRAANHHIWADPVRIQQVFWNLLNNAVKFTPKGGRVTIRSSNEGEQFVFEISDTGIGIETERQSRIFEAFDQGELSITRQFGGLGLGLTISKTLLDLHGGRISVQSEGKNRGTTFRVFLDLLREPLAVSIDGADGADGDAAPTRNLHLLLVDDHADTRLVLSRLLSKFGHEVATADSQQRALKLLESGRFDALISDIGLPDGDGYDLVRVAKRRQPLSAIALSGYGTEEDVRRSLEAGFDYHLTKPVDLNGLRSLLQKIAKVER
ncbi:MAG TPA: PAS domain S-box protein [Chthoniobacterales bacterium]|nr:PAS domain S-box protein [Chthoniobacterales bacterium]